MERLLNRSAKDKVDGKKSIIFKISSFLTVISLFLRSPSIIYGAKAVPLEKEKTSHSENMEEKYKIALPRDLRRDLGLIIEFAVKNKAMAEFSLRDFYHCHLLFDKPYSTKGYEDNPLDFFVDQLSDYKGILCHTQEDPEFSEEKGLDRSKRNIALWRGEEPFFARKESGIGEDKYQFMLDEPDSPYTVRDEDLDAYYGVTLYFSSSNDGNLRLPKGTVLDVEVRHADLFFEDTPSTLGLQ